MKSTLGIKTDEEVCQIDNVRKFFDIMRLNADACEVEKKDLTIKQNGVEMDISILRPLGSGDKILPVIMCLHGGGWIMCDYSSHRSITNYLLEKLSCCVVFVNYSLSPEVKYPVALNQCQAALYWMKENSESFHFDYKSIAVAGDSSGGNLATSLALQESGLGNFDISYQVLIHPVTNDNFESKSYIENQNDSFVPRNLMQYFWHSYTGKPEDRSKNTMAPLRSTLEQLEKLPPTLIISAENDVLRSEGEEYASKLIDANVPTVAVRYLGAKHEFISDAVLGQQGQAALSQIADALKKHWGSKKF